MTEQESDAANERPKRNLKGLGLAPDTAGSALDNETKQALESQVADLQGKLAAMGYYHGRLDGDFGDRTADSLSRFQHAADLQVTGVLDDATGDKLAVTPPYTFDEILKRELAQIAAGREAVGLGHLDSVSPDASSARRADQARLFGLAFSGGGIRSATFNLGVLQGLARLGLLRELDYLSSVSGGGYIGSWLHAWVKRERDAGEGGISAVERRLAPNPAAAPSEPPQVNWLRRYSNYLTPRTGLFGADTLAGVATWLRNVLLNQALLVTLVLVLLCLPWVLLAWSVTPLFGPPADLGWGGLLALFGAASMALGIGLAGRETALASAPPEAQPAADADTPPSQARLQGAYRVLALLACGVLLLGLTLPLAAAWELPAWLWIGAAPALYVPAFALGWLGACRGRVACRGRRLGPVWWALVAVAPLALLFSVWTPPASLDPEQRMHQIVLGPPLVLLVLLLLVTLHLGLASRRFRESVREWWSRLGGLLIRLGLVWLLVSGIALYARFGMLYLGAWIAAAGGLAWLVTTLLGLLAGGKTDTDGTAPGGWKELLATAAPYVFVLGLLIGISWGLHVAIERLAGSPLEQEFCPTEVAADKVLPGYQLSLQGDETLSGSLLPIRSGQVCYFDTYAANSLQLLADLPLPPVVFLLLLAALAAVLAWRIDVNVFSLHMFYRDRLERCYLGASNSSRRRNAFHGFDPDDSPRLLGLKGNRPYPLLNSAINLTRANNLAWQERKAGSFVFTPDHCGYQQPTAGEAPLGAYQSTEDYLAEEDNAWLALGTPLTVSGAAASPNWGYHTNPATAFLMTMFNVRLGWWIQNPGNSAVWRRAGPKWSLWYLLRELAGLTTDTSNYVYVSDGGHFENLGIYELVRRRCRYILVCDGGCDPEYRYEDLGNAIRKCRIDLGVEIEIDTSAITPDPERGCSQFHCAVGRIYYEPADAGSKTPPGYLLYIKASLTGDEPTDVQQYRSEHPRFPHQTTADQWFAESQFESYRKLGKHALLEVMQCAAEDARQAAGGSGCDREVLFLRLAERWYTPSRHTELAFSKHGEAVVRLFDQIRQEPSLGFFDAQIYPEWGPMTQHLEPAPDTSESSLLPKTEPELRAGFYLCIQMIQLMENVYLDLDLEGEHRHPDNRGWMNLFRHWSWSGMLRVTWAVAAGTYGARFQRFCARELGLKLGECSIGDPIPVSEVQGSTKLNPVEQDIVQELLQGPAKDGGLELSVLPLELEVANPLGGAEKPFKFHFGFALVRRAPDEVELVFYRVQDHLRRMGLGRRGLELLATGCPRAEIRVPPKLSERFDPGRRQLLRLWHSVRAAAQGGL